MTNILHITASIRGSDQSVSRSLSAKLVERLAKDGATVTTRDLAANDLPFITADRFGANLTPEADRTDAQRELAGIADTLIAELLAADTIVFGVPIYISLPAPAPPSATPRMALKAC